MFFRKSHVLPSSQRTPKRPARSTCRLETLEDRQMLSVNISEIHFSPTDGDLFENQYIELRGDAGGTVPNDMYLLSIESDGSANPGEINAIFDLGGLSVGSNGYLVFTQETGAYDVDPDAAEYKGRNVGFRGIPGGVFQSNSISGQIQSADSSESFVIIENVSGNSPQLGSDVDTNNDGTLDPSLNWSVVDSATYLKPGIGGTVTGDISYGSIVFRTSGNASTVSPSATLVDLDEVGYMARVLNTSGFEADDWVAGATAETSTAFAFELSDGDHGVPSPTFFAGKALDHVGSDNFFASVSGTIAEYFYTFIDRTNNGNPGAYTFDADPDREPAGAPLINAFPGATLTAAGADHQPNGNAITAAVTGSNAATGTQSFATDGVAEFSDVSQLRIDFFEPTNVVQIDFTGGSAAGDSVGVLKAFDVDGNEIGMFMTPPLALGVSETMAISTTANGAGIASAVAFVDSSSPENAGLLDNLQYRLEEESTTAGPGGTYTISPVWEHEPNFTVRSYYTSAARGMTTAELPATDIDFDSDPARPADIFGRSPDGGLNFGRITPIANSMIQLDNWGSFYNGVNWDDILIADVTGDGKDDVAGRTDGGQWWIAESNGQAFQNSYWGNWSSTVTWEDVVVGDFDGDGKDDIAGRTNGQWWVSHSQGDFFTVEYWGSWSNSVTWEDVVAGDFNNDGRTDIAGRADGNWWVSNSQGTFFTVEYWGSWSNSVTWEDVLIADVNGDHRNDIVGRTNGQWWVARSNGSAFATEYWGSWSTSLNWDHVLVADINGDTMDDILGITDQDDWWVSSSLGSQFNTGRWTLNPSTAPNSVGWEPVKAASFGTPFSGQSVSASDAVFAQGSVAPLPIFAGSDDVFAEDEDQVTTSVAVDQARYARARARRSGRFE